MNCHPQGDSPLQGLQMHAHEPPVSRGVDDHGDVGMRCQGCHQEHNVDHARVPGAPKWHVAWTRGDDLHHDYLTTVSAQKLTAGLDASGKLLAWRHRTAFPPIDSTFDASVNRPSRNDLQQGALDLGLAVPNVSAEGCEAAVRTRIGWLRSVYNIFHGFAVGSFIDEIAHAKKADPISVTLLSLLGFGPLLGCGGRSPSDRIVDAGEGECDGRPLVVGDPSVLINSRSVDRGELQIGGAVVGLQSALALVFETGPDERRMFTVIDADGPVTQTFEVALAGRHELAAFFLEGLLAPTGPPRAAQRLRGPCALRAERQAETAIHPSTSTKRALSVKGWRRADPLAAA